MRRRNGTPKFTETDIINAFREETPSKTAFGNFRIEGNELIYRAQTSVDAPSWYDDKDFTEARQKIGELIKEHDGKLVSDGKMVLLEALTKQSPSNKLKVQYFEINTVAKRVKEDSGYLFFGNYEILPLVGRTVAYGNVSENHETAPIQHAMRDAGFTMLPFSKFENADFDTYEQLDSSPGYQVSVKEERSYGSYIRQNTTASVNKYFSGALLFKLNGKTYLKDIDQRERKYGYMNAFVTELPETATTIDRAYQTLKPKEVLDAEAAGLKVQRQGSAFFIPVDAPILPVLTLEERLLILGAKTYALEPQEVRALTGFDCEKHDKRADELLKKIPSSGDLVFGRKKNAVATAIELNDIFYCKGEVTRDRSAKLNLETWHIAVAGLGD